MIDVFQKKSIHYTKTDFGHPFKMWGAIFGDCSPAEMNICSPFFDPLLQFEISISLLRYASQHHPSISACYCFGLTMALEQLRASGMLLAAVRLRLLAMTQSQQAASSAQCEHQHFVSANNLRLRPRRLPSIKSCIQLHIVFLSSVH